LKAAEQIGGFFIGVRKGSALKNGIALEGAIQKTDLTP
jgi:hypothetical protein